MHRSFLIVILALASLPVLTPAATRNPPATAVPDDDPEEAAERREFAKRLVVENCQICHASDLIESQRLTPKQWKAEVEKMTGWGSPLPPDQIPAVTNYLAAEYPVDGKPAAESRLSTAIALDGITAEPPGDKPRLKGDPVKGEAVHAKNCANCHGLDGQGAELGPNLVDRPVLLRPFHFNEVIRKGRGRMPAFANLIDESAEANLFAWLRGRRYVPHPPK